MSQRNVPIALLLESNMDNKSSQNQNSSPNSSQQQPFSASNTSSYQAIKPENGRPMETNSQAGATISPTPENHSRQPQITQSRGIQSLVSQFQPRLDYPPNSAQSPIIIDEPDDRSSPADVVIVEDQDRRSKLPLLPATFKKATSVAYQPLQIGTGKSGVLDHIKNFQTSFKLGEQQYSDSTGGGTPVQPLAPWPQALKLNPSKTSITSIINAEDDSSPQNQQDKKRKPPAKADSSSKKPKTENSKKPKVENKLDSTPALAPKKSAPKSKKKTPDLSSTPQDKQEKGSMHATATTDRSKAPKLQVQLEKPSIIDVKKESNSTQDTTDSKHNQKDFTTEDKKDKAQKAEMPVIALNIPLLDPKDPKPGQAEVVVNVLKLAEDKYGWNVIHPNAKSAIDLMDEMLEDEDDGADEDEDDDLQVVDEKGNPAQKKTEELTEEQLAKRHETKMNRKVGKYDYEDPFIDDEELQWEEEITTTKEGFFVYWGPLVEDRSATGSTKKGASKSKK